MSPEITQKLLAINEKFYREFAESWHTSRLLPWVGFGRIAELVPSTKRFLDVGCGNGRLGIYLTENQLVDAYVGVDQSQGLLDAASARMDGTFVQRDLAQPDALADLGMFDAAACLAVLHHIPGEANRVRLLDAIYAQLEPGALLVVSNFRFNANPRMLKKIVDWEQVGLNSADLEPNDHLLNWDRGGKSIRYLNLIDEASLERHVAQTNFTLIETFHSDGREGNLNLYGILRK